MSVPGTDISAEKRCKPPEVGNSRLSRLSCDQPIVVFRTVFEEPCLTTKSWATLALFELVCRSIFSTSAPTSILLSSLKGRPKNTPTPWLSTVYAAVSDRKSTRLNSSHSQISYAVFCLKKKK